MRWQFSAVRYSMFHKISISFWLASLWFILKALIAMFFGPNWGPFGTQVDPMLAPWTLLSRGFLWIYACCLFLSQRRVITIYQQYRLMVSKDHFGIYCILNLHWSKTEMTAYIWNIYMKVNVLRVIIVLADNPDSCECLATYIYVCVYIYIYILLSLPSGRM